MHSSGFHLDDWTPVTGHWLKDHTTTKHALLFTNQISQYISLHWLCDLSLHHLQGVSTSHRMKCGCNSNVTTLQRLALEMGAAPSCLPPRHDVGATVPQLGRHSSRSSVASSWAYIPAGTSYPMKCTYDGRLCTPSRQDTGIFQSLLAHEQLPLIT